MKERDYKQEKGGIGRSAIKGACKGEKGARVERNKSRERKDKPSKRE